MINVVDRVSTYPGRVKLTKANGTSEYVTWERADQPTVEGTPINKALFDSIAADMGLSSAVTVYVSKSGSDTLGNGTSANPYLTITKAISTLPKNLNGFGATINIAAGTYNETARFEHFYGGVIAINGVSGAGITITGLNIQNCAVLVNVIALTVGSAGIFIGTRGMLYCATATITVTGAPEAVILRYGALVEIPTTLTINNATTRAVQVQYASTFSVATLAGTGNSVGIYAYNSSVYVSKSTISATTPTINDNATMSIRT